MNLNLYNNFRAMYYNTLANFYLCFNTFVPYYDDVIISLSITSFKNIINNNLNLKSIKKNRMMQLLYSLNDNDKLIIDDGYIIIYYNEDAKICATDACDYEHNVEDTEDHVEDTEDHVEDTEDHVEDTEDHVEDTEDPVEDTEDHVEDTEDHVEDTEDPVEDTEDHVEDTDNPTTSASSPDTSDINPETDAISEPYNSSDKKNN